MIKIVKPGQKEFHGYCDRCGCEFTYEFEDISISGTVECPTCGKHYYHPSKGLTNPGTIGWPTPGEPIPCNIPSDTGLNPCSNCDWWKKMQQPGFTYVGDTPCTWCPKGPYRVTCDTVVGTSTMPSNSLQAIKDLADYSGTPNTCAFDTVSSSLRKCNCKE